MKKILTILALLLCCTHAAHAQGMQVAAFRLLENDLTAMTHGTERKDQNGETWHDMEQVYQAYVEPWRVLAEKKGVNLKLGECGIFIADHSRFSKAPYYQKHVVAWAKDFAGRTYEMVLDIGTGRYVTVTTQMAEAEVTIDGHHEGRAPIYRRYLTFGPHRLVATMGRHEGALQVDITQQTEQGQVLSVPMEDMSHLYGDVTLTTEANTDILFQGRKVGTGRWQTQLREGSYSVVTARADCDSVRTSFNVKRGEQNVVKATPPTQHTGYLQIYLKPRNAQIHLDGRNATLDMTQRQTLPVGLHEMQFSRKGYVSQTHSYQIPRNETVTDTVQLERVTYVRPLAFYFGGGYTMSTLGGITAMAGAVFYRHDVQASYTFGLNESDPVNWYHNTTGQWLSTVAYKQSALALHYGYQVNLMRQLAITPQVGYRLSMLSGNVQAGQGSYGDSGKASVLTLGVKLLLVPMQHFYLFAAPEYGVVLSQNTYYKHTADISNYEAGGFAVTAGLLFSF